jgi:hypothetical protein
MSSERFCAVTTTVSMAFESAARAACIPVKAVDANNAEMKTGRALAFDQIPLMAIPLQLCLQGCQSSVMELSSQQGFGADYLPFCVFRAVGAACLRSI